MGNAICCSSGPGAQAEPLFEKKKPVLFGKLHTQSDGSDSDEKLPLEERLRDLVAKIRKVKHKLDLSQKQQSQLREEVLLTHQSND